MNPSSWSSRIQIAIIALIATFIALYLGLYQWRFISFIWDPVFGDGSMKVLDSDVSHDITQIIRIPDAMLGVFAYFSDIIFALAGSEKRWQDRPWLVIVFGIDVIPLGIVSIILVLLQGLVVKHWCFLCLVTASISLTLIFMAYGEVIASCTYLYEIKKRSNWKTAWWALWGYPSPESEAAGIATLQKRNKTGVGPNL